MSSVAKTEERQGPGGRVYQKPLLAKGPILTSVTAIKTVSGSAAPCWVARAAFGEADIRWMLFREWLLQEAPAWFRRLYLRHGEKIGTWLQGHTTMQPVVRLAMRPAISRILSR